MKKILISACLLGEKVRYDGNSKPVNSKIISQWLAENRLIPVCPEVAGGLSVPRLPAEIVYAAPLHLKNIAGQDVTAYFTTGAEKTLKIALENKVIMAVLKEGSPSCGSTYIYDGTFSGTKKMGKGVTSELLEKNGIKVFNENQLSIAEMFLKNKE